MEDRMMMMMMMERAAYLRKCPQEVLERKCCRETMNRDGCKDGEDSCGPLQINSSGTHVKTGKRRWSLTMIPIPAAVMIWKSTHMTVGESAFNRVNKPNPMSIRIQPTKFTGRYLAFFLTRPPAKRDTGAHMSVVASMLTLEWIGLASMQAWKYTGR